MIYKMNILVFFSPGRDLGRDEVFITTWLSPKQFLLSFKLFIVESEALAVEALVIETFVHLCTRLLSDEEEKHAYLGSCSILTRRKSLPQAGPIPAAKCFSTPSRPSASLACTVIAFPSAAPHNLATSSAYFQRSVPQLPFECISKVAGKKSQYRISLFSTNHNLLPIPYPPLILNGFRNPQGNISTSNPTHTTRPNGLGEET